jgi:drug/metabolite transporter (DMT)-like permease
VDHENAGAYAALVTVQLLFATLPIAGKFGLEEIHPTVFIAVRVAVGALCLFALEQAIHASPIPDASDLGRLAVYAVLGVVLNMGLYIWGLDLSTAINAVLLMTLIPVYTYGIAVVAGHEAFEWPRAIGIVVAMAGVLVLLDPTKFSLSNSTLLGNLLILGNTLAYSIYLVVSRPILARIEPLTVISWIFLFGGLMLVPVALLQAGPEAFLVSQRSAGILAYVILGPTVAVYALNLWALERVSSSTVAAFIYLQPVAGVLLAWWLLGEPVHLRTLVAGLLVFAGVALVTLYETPEPADELAEPT